MDLNNLRWLGRWVGVSAAAVMLCVGLSGCSRLQRKPADQYVYVTAKQSFLVDRVAAVSNRTGEVTNGEKLVVLGRARHWVQVRTPRGEVGWIKERETADQALAAQFEALRVKHVLDATVASARARDDVYLHVGPGIQTDRFFRLAEGDKLSLLQRAVVEKQLAPGAAVAKAAPAVAPKAGEAVEGPPPPAMEDWWLVRDAKGDTGWIYSHMIDVDAPDTLARYAEGQRIVAAYVLGHADDPDSGILENGVTVTSIPEYVTVLGPYKAGLPYDFDQVRVFTWNTKKHRYETAYREHDVAGYMPVVISQEKDPYGKSADAATPMPAFTYKVLAGDAELPAPDAETGALKPAKLVAKTYRLEGNLCRRILAPGTAPAEFHMVVEEKKAGKKGKK
jgi:SH3-like domain-containing protein